LKFDGLRRTGHRRMTRRDERRRDRSEIGRKAALGFEPLAKAGAEEKIPEARHDAASDEYAAALR